MKKLLRRLHRRLHLPGRVALASLALLGMLSTTGAFAQGGQDHSGWTVGGAQTVGNITGGGFSQVSDEWENLFGWSVGEVTITAPFQCIGCNCGFVGGTQISETFIAQACEIISETALPISCPNSSSGNCPSGMSGSLKAVTYECCLVVKSWVFCVSNTVFVTACP